MTPRLRTTAVVTVALTGAVIVGMDWLPTALNRNIRNIEAIQRVPGTFIHGGACALAVLALTRGPRWTQRWVPAWFTFVFTSAILNWWVPYIAGSYPGEIDPRTFKQEYAANLSVLPSVADHPVIPDVQHMLIHALLLTSVVLTALVAFGRRREDPDRGAGPSALRSGQRAER